MKQEFFTAIPQNMQEYKMSIREADNENDIFRVAFDEACKDDKPADAREESFAWDFFKYGWEAAVRLLNDDATVLELRAEVERLRAELAAGVACEGGNTSEKGGAQSATKPAETRMDSALHAGAQVPSPAAGAEKDAERLQWLHEQNATLDSGRWIVSFRDFVDGDDVENHWVGSDLRGAIDAAIAAHTKSKESK